MHDDFNVMHFFFVYFCRLTFFVSTISHLVFCLLKIVRLFVVCVCRVANCVCSKYSTILFLSRCCRESDAVFYLCTIQIHCCTVACIISISFNQSIACFFDQNQTNNSCSGSDDNNRNSKNVDRMRYTVKCISLR